MTLFLIQRRHQTPGRYFNSPPVADWRTVGRFEASCENEALCKASEATGIVNPQRDLRVAGIVSLICPIVQVIKPVLQGAIVTVGEMREILNDFDFTIVRAALLSPTEGLADADFVEDDKAWKLKLKNIHCPISSLMRCIKYSRKGYWLGLTESVKLFMNWNERGEDYQFKLIDLIGKMKGPNGEEPSKEDIEEAGEADERRLTMTPTIQESELLRVRHARTLVALKAAAICSRMHGDTWVECWQALRDDKRFPDCTDTEITELVNRVYSTKK